MTLNEIIGKYGVEYLGRFYSTYRAIVLEEKDPSNRNSLYISIPSIYGGVQTWALPKHQDGGPNYGIKGLTPKKGQIVYVEFEYGDPLKALWSYHGWAIDDKPEELNNDTLGIITPNGVKVIINETNKTLNITVPENITLISKGINFIEGKVGVPESNKILKQLNIVEEKLNTIINAIKNDPGIPIPGVLELKALSTLIPTIIGDTLDLTAIEDIASENIKQPN